MKKIIFFLAIAVLTLTSCQKEEYEITPETQVTNNFKIFVKDGLKSGVININSGDTITVGRNMPTVFWSTKENGDPKEIIWMVDQTLSDNPGNSTSYQKNYYGDQIATKCDDPGYYMFYLEEYPGSPSSLTFYAYVSGQFPGKIGDDYGDGGIFRMEKKYYPASSETKLLIYFKFSDNYAEEDLQAKLFDWEQGGPTLMGLTKYPFSTENYYYFMLDISGDLFNDCISAEFLGPNGKDPNIWESAWAKIPEGVINFCLP